MSEIDVALVLPSGSTRNAEVPDDVPVRELVPELTTTLELPTTGPDGHPTNYRLDSKALGRELQDEETLSDAGVPEGDRLMITADITAGYWAETPTDFSPASRQIASITFRFRKSGESDWKNGRIRLSIWQSGWKYIVCGSPD